MELVTISFKVEEGIAQELDRRADGGGSRHQEARKIVLEVLTDAERYRVFNELAATREQIDRMRHDLATAVVALLVRAGKVDDPKDAEQWVRRAMLGE
jgi:hypothetical protein